MVNKFCFFLGQSVEFNVLVALNRLQILTSVDESDASGWTFECQGQDLKKCEVRQFEGSATLKLVKIGCDEESERQDTKATL